MTALLLALAAGFGVFYVFTAVAFGWRGVGFGPRVERVAPRRDRRAEFLAQAGLADVRLLDLTVVVLALGLFAGLVGWLVFAGPIPAVIAFTTGALAPVTAARNRRRARMGRAREAWPRMIEEIRLLTMSVGQSIPQALFTVGGRGPEEMRPAFDDAYREWLISTDFDRTVAVLKQRLADPTADATLETLLIAYEIGGTDVDQRLAALVEDRIQDLQGRKDATSKQAGVKFARWFVLGVPLAMALVGLSIGTGRNAYQSSLGQVAVVLGLGLMGLCWLWAGRLMRLPEEDRVFY